MIINKDFHTYYKYVISREYDKYNITTFLKTEHDYSVRCINKIKKEGQLLVNGVPSYFSKEIKIGDEIIVYFPTEQSFGKPVKLSLDIIYEDEDLLIINKQPFMSTHITRRHRENTLENALSYEFQNRKESIKIRFVNRLDMDTSGLLIVAKNKYVHHFLQNQNTLGKMKRKYLALCDASPTNVKGVINKAIRRNSKDNIRREVCNDKEGKSAMTGYKVIQQKHQQSLLELKLFTGRTHQIRVHLEYIGCPITGDTLYNKNKSDLIQRQALHAYYLKFMHPRTKKEVEFKIDLPEDMKKLLI